MSKKLAVRRIFFLLGILILLILGSCSYFSKNQDYTDPYHSVIYTPD